MLKLAWIVTLTALTTATSAVAGYNVATMLAPNRMELCYLSQSAAARIASCTELTKQP